MTKRSRASARQVLAYFKALGKSEQRQFIRLAVNEFDNALAAIAHERDFARLDEMVADHERRITEIKLARRTRKPDIARDKEIIRMREAENLTFGQIGKYLQISDAAARQRYNRAMGRVRESATRRAR